VDFCLVFAAILGNYKPGHLKGMMEGEVDGIQTTQEVLVGNAIMMVIPSVMVFLSLILPNPVIRWANIILGIFFIGVVFITLAYYFTHNIQTWAYYYVFVITEIVLYGLIIRYAWVWG
jgi:hypothetical protein